MSTVKADFFTWRNGEATAQVSPTITGQQLVRGVAKSWLNYDGVTPAIRASFNVSSVTNNATGDITETFSVAIADNSYTAVISGFKNNFYSTVVSQYWNVAYATGRTASTYRTTYIATSTYTAQNPDALDTLIFR